MSGPGAAWCCPQSRVSGSASGPCGCRGVQQRSRVAAVGVTVRTRAGRFTGCVRRRDVEVGGGAVERETRVYCRNVGLVREVPPEGRIDLVRVD